MTSLPAHEILGFVAGALGLSAFVPQVIKVWRQRSTGDISLLTFSLLTVATVLWIVYAIIASALSLLLANALTLVLIVAILVAKLRFG
jgi:MtN3 and saliva related transmembrane protein